MGSKPCAYVFCPNNRDNPVSMYCKTCRTAEVIIEGNIQQRHCGYCRKFHTLDQFVGKTRVCVVKQAQRLEKERRKRIKVSDEDDILLDIKTLLEHF